MSLSCLLDNLNNYSPAIQAFTTVVLAFLTYFSLRATAKMAKTMTAQITPNLVVSNLKLKTNNLNEEKVKNMNIHTFSLFLELQFNLRNMSAGNGSIDKPTLNLIIDNNPVYSIKPRTTERGNFVRQRGPMEEYETLDLGSTIFLRGGDSIFQELVYSPDYRDVKELKELEELMSKLKNNFKSLKFSISYKDNFNKSYEFPIEDIIN